MDMLLHLEDDKLAMPLPNPLAHPTNHKLDTGITANLTSDDGQDHRITVNLTSDNKQDPPTLWHVKQSKYWNEWLTVMHEELEALKVKDVYEEVKELLHGRKAVQCKWVLHIK